MGLGCTEDTVFIRLLRLGKVARAMRVVRQTEVGREWTFDSRFPSAEGQ